MSPAPTTRTRAPTAERCVPNDHRPASCSRTKNGMPRCAARVAATAHSAVAGVWAQRALQSRTPSGSRPTKFSAPALSSCTRRRWRRPSRKPLSGTVAPPERGTQICARAASPDGGPSAGSTWCARTRGESSSAAAPSAREGTSTCRVSPGSRGRCGTVPTLGGGRACARTVNGGGRRAGTRAARLLVVVLAAAALSGCGGGGYTPSGPFRPLPEGAPPEVGPPSSSAPIPGDPAQPGAGEQGGDPNVVASGLAVPTGLVLLPDGSAIVGERDTGRLLQVFPDRSPARELMTVPGIDAAGDGGLLGLALSPTYVEDGLLYAYVSTATDNRVVHFPLGGTPNPVLTGIPRGERHNGGGLLFGSDGTLFVGTGDAGDPALGSDPGSLAGKVLQIDVFGRPVGPSPVLSRGYHNVTALCQSPVPDEAGRGALYATDDAAEGPDAVDLVVGGADYGTVAPMIEVPAEE